ncbi:Leucine-rich repeat domain, L domain-like [Phytophthora cactorum]|nr:Leucine-rich repeat domain, L domain-like [Phytophthora cactorum]
MTMKKLKLMRKYRLGVHGSLREEDDDEMMDGPPIKSRHKSLMPMNPAILPGLILSPTPKSVTKTEEKHAVGKFETHDSKWKATIDGEVEKFMYPSLRLETLYSDGMIPDLVDDSDDNSMPSPKTIDEVLASTSKVNWELERVVPSPVTNAVQADSKRLEFDQKLHDAEAILRKREAASMRIEYYADKQHLFTKWKKVGNSQHHQLSPLPPTTVQHESSDEEEEDDSDLEPEADMARTSHSGSYLHGGEQLAAALACNTTLTELDLSHNALTGASAVTFGFFLRQNQSLRTLISLSVHDLETSTTGSTASSPIFDGSLPSASSPFELKMGESPYAFAVATFKTPVKLRGSYQHVELCRPVSWLDEESCLGLIQIVKRGFSSRDMMSLLDLVLADLQLTTTQAAFFTLDVSNRWRERICFLTAAFDSAEQWRLIDRFGPVMMQFSTANPTGHWTLTLRDARHRKLALWFASLNAHHTAIVARYHPKLTDCSQYGRGFHWRNVVFNQKRIQLTYSFFDCLPRDGVLEFDYVSPVRPEDRYLEDNYLEYQDGSELDQTVIQSAQVAMTDEELAALLAQVGAEVCAVYVPVHKRQNLKYHLVLFHLAIAARRVMARQAHHVLQHFPKNYESGRLRALVAMHHAIVDLECFGELLDRLALTDRPRVYTNLGYLNTVMPLAIDMDFEVDFTREDEKMLLRALVDLSISCPMDMIRIDSTRSTVLIIYSMYQTNTVPASGRICFRYNGCVLDNRFIVTFCVVIG